MTNRNPNIKTEFQGVRFVQGVVQDNHSIFQNLSRENDQGNDCYIEFVRNGLATNYGIFVQIKSGDSYKDSLGYKFTADKAHLEYWNQGLNLTVGIVFDPEIKKAFWVDVTSYLTSRPDIFTQSYHTIRVDKANEFSEATFPAFIEYCFSFRQLFSSYEKFGRALEWFANIDNSSMDILDKVST
ncbi:DUF4365 domain-containing protein [Flavobacterium cupreum]|uniref:DUF4365 domain-containing protein n=2 Tax=Flavobacterium TaxID=237 RepID=A0A940XC57_9FLAO|nr:MULTISPECIES: DUF4365 domain-containing protein [Flavobacterium]MBP4139787.1 DUF4365 domain-containing protein [Flavobacterium geliluteum]RUT67772.1 DUF4365 domain-containing protein [Flavobacterium cupreum]